MGQLHHVLRHYKDSQDAGVRAELTTRAAALLYRFLGNHRECIEGAAGRDWDLVTSIPSTGGRHGKHPLERIILMLSSIRDEYEATLRPGSAALDHNAASDDGLEVTADVEGRAVLIVDDTFTSGARAQSAASTLQLAGASVVAVVPIGRYVRPDYNDAAQALWDSARSISFSFDRCCLE
jgi:phosphoribosylpyrophosphate synthetase